jgi:hypothetical protein
MFAIPVAVFAHPAFLLFHRFYARGLSKKIRSSDADMKPASNPLKAGEGVLKAVAHFKEMPPVDGEGGACDPAMAGLTVDHDVSSRFRGIRCD